MSAGAGTGSRYASLLSDARVRAWWENTRRGSEGSASTYLRVFGLLLGRVGLTVDGLLDLARRNPVALRNRVASALYAMEEEGLLGSTLQIRKAVVSSFLRFNGIDVPLKIRIRGATQHPRSESERVPSRDELARAMRAADPRARVAIALMAYSGLRPEVMGDFSGADGLRLGDLPDLSIEDGSVRFMRVPAVLVVRANLSKARHRYLTFIPEEGAAVVEEYMEARARSGEALGQGSPVVASSRGGFVSSRTVSDIVRKALRDAGLGVRPYALRGYFATALDVAEARGIVSHPWRQFWMGHKGDIEAEYSTRKSLAPEIVEGMRSSFARASKLLVAGFMPPREDPRTALYSEILRLAGYSEDEISSVDFRSIDPAGLRGLLERKAREASARRRQVVVGADEAEGLISEGYEFVAVLPNGRVVLRQPQAGVVGLLAGVPR